MSSIWQKYGKTHVALVGSLATWAVATFPNTTVAHVAAAVLAVLTALGVYAAPHKPKKKPRAVKKV